MTPEVHPHNNCWKGVMQTSAYDGRSDVDSPLMSLWRSAAIGRSGLLISWANLSMIFWWLCVLFACGRILRPVA